jgi:predicted nucleic acid-binding protein
MTTTGVRVFIDTNILLRATVQRMPLHSECNDLIMQLWSDNSEIWISRQILREYLVQVTHPRTINPPLSLAEVYKQVEKIRSLFRIADDTDSVTTHLMALLRTHPTGGKQIHDANVIATMLAYEISTLVTRLEAVCGCDLIANCSIKR